jgi:S1-C subfamily serine protease
MMTTIISPHKRRAVAFVVTSLFLLCAPHMAKAQSDTPERLGRVLDTVVGVDTRIPDNARTESFLGTTRQGSGVVISEDGLVLTIGYLILEALEIDIVLNTGRKIPASFVAYDHESGFGLVRAASDIPITPAQLGSSGDTGVSTQVVLANRLGPDAAQGVFVVDRREFVGAWEYLLDSAIYTSPPNPNFSGAGLFNADGKLIRIGSLLVGNATFLQRPLPGNMFVPIDELKPILDDMISGGRRADAPRPWLGIAPSEIRDRVFIDRVSPESPAARAGIHAGELILAVDDAPVVSMSGLFRAIWRGRQAGDPVMLRLLTPEGQVRDVSVDSMDRNDWLRIDPSL